jgi:hypothetical protein
MDDQSKIFVGVAVGGLVGAVLMSVCMTDRGRGSMTRLDDALDELAEALGRFRGTVRRASSAASEGRALVDDFRETVLEQRPAPRPREVS